MAPGRSLGYPGRPTGKFSKIFNFSRKFCICFPIFLGFSTNTTTTTTTTTTSSSSSSSSSGVSRKSKKNRETYAKFSRKIKNFRKFSRGPPRVPQGPPRGHGKIFENFWIFRNFWIFFIDLLMDF